ncbi:hypothetical protein O6H91_21G013200 [Diphasiastrum complanatum]|uniref:Uncharacterized protein n=1 Tax=Diphasiastrum complanatum TaxID=34168 RepID=A0ACC2AHX8_DIPCM|nr:hypothetical protein O6H91_21G013200 [Diphasiastrum complanatum]
MSRNSLVILELAQNGPRFICPFWDLWPVMTSNLGREQALLVLDQCIYDDGFLGCTGGSRNSSLILGLAQNQPQQLLGLQFFTESSHGGKLTSAKAWNRQSSILAQPAEIVEVAVDATKEIRKYAVEWALKNVVQAGDFITLVAVIPESNLISCSTWGLTGECAFRTRPSTSDEFEEQITDSCHQMLRQVQKLQDEKKVRIKVKVIEDGVRGIAALQAERMRATWVILDRNLSQEGKYCLKRLQCNVVIVNRSDAQILRLNLKRSMGVKGDSAREIPSDNPISMVPESNSSKVYKRFDRQEAYGARKSPHSSSVSDQSMQTSSPEMEVSFTSTEPGTTLNFSSGSTTSPRSSVYPDLEPITTFSGFLQAGVASASNYSTPSFEYGSREVSSNSDSDQPSPVKKVRPESSSAEVLSRLKHSNTGNSFSASQPSSPKLISRVYWNKLSEELGKPTFSGGSSRSEPFPRQAQNFSNQRDDEIRYMHKIMRSHSSRSITNSLALRPVERTTVSDLFAFSNEGFETVAPASTIKASAMSLWNGILTQDKDVITSESNTDVPEKLDLDYSSNLRKSMSLSRQAPPGPPPLCSICQHKAPHFGRPPQKFSYADLEIATNVFSKENFLAEGGFGSVHRGILTNGQPIAVKQLKLASSQGDKEFCAEVEVLSCAQQRNVVTLIGYCIEDHRRLLVYEFICNGSLDSHLYGQKRPPLEWQARHKIAVGTARGLRYLHEECRVGCIIHRDMRPNNILLTHDFEPMVGDFGLARWQPDGALGVETRVIGTFGYLAPEYAQSGQITEKADVYAFGIVLLELVTGHKAIDLSRPKGQQCLTEWARPFLEAHQYHELVDSRLRNHYNDYEMYCMLQTAYLCICQNPDFRPRMSQVLRMLEGDVMLERSGVSTSWSSRHGEPFSFWY